MCDRRTDRQMDGQNYNSQDCSTSIASSRGKNVEAFPKFRSHMVVSLSSSTYSGQTVY